MFQQNRTSDDRAHMSGPLRGYIEGYYGRLLHWDERSALLRHLHHLGMTAYLYAPKEDPYHRLNWRHEYDNAWQVAFQKFCREGDAQSVKIIAGIAPGMDYDYGQIGSDNDWHALLAKSMMMVERGASAIALLLDDIQPDMNKGTSLNEGEAHAALSNALREEMAKHDVPIILTPRIYADEVIDHDIMTAGKNDARYWPDLMQHLHKEITLLICGRYVIAPDTTLDDTVMAQAGIDVERAVIWDNLYAHDYCPRKLYLGRYQTRHAEQNILLSPTGMIATDKLLLTIMAAGDDEKAWAAALKAHNVPDAFHKIAPFFDLPPHPETDYIEPELNDVEGLLEALDILLWNWKSDLAREWYPFLMGLKQDIMLITGKTSDLRKRKSLPDLLRQNLKSET